MTLECSECGNEFPTSKFNPDCPSPTVCFRCRVSGLQIGFGGFREQFHEGTNAQRGRDAFNEAKANGLDPVPANYAGGHTPSASQLAKVKTVLDNKKYAAAL